MNGHTKLPLRSSAACKPVARNQAEAERLVSQRNKVQEELNAKLAELAEAETLQNAASSQLTSDKVLQEVYLESLEKVHARLQWLADHGAPDFKGRNSSQSFLLAAWTEQEEKGDRLMEKLDMLEERIEKEKQVKYPGRKFIARLNRERAMLQNELDSLKE